MGKSDRWFDVRSVRSSEKRETNEGEVNSDLQRPKNDGILMTDRTLSARQLQ